MFHPSQFTVTSNTIKAGSSSTNTHLLCSLHTTQTKHTSGVVCARAAARHHQRPAMKSSSSAGSLRLKLKQEQACDGSSSKMQGSLELRLGISSDNGGGDPWVGEGVHPWSLASRQEKAAALEQAQQPVGWPPVCAFRRSHLAGGGAKAGEEPATSKVAGASGERERERPPAAAAAAGMFVKVNLEGCAVGRKVDLQAHRGYASLSRALQAMFHAFLSGGQWRIAGREDDDDEDERWRQPPEPTTKSRKTYILLYEDHEGDRMLVGDVPWEMFMASVKRLYIAQDPIRKN